MFEGVDWTSVAADAAAAALTLQGAAPDWLTAPLQAAADSPAVKDAIRFGHVLAVVLGLGSAMLLEATLLSRSRMPLTEETLDLIRRAHRMIGVAVLALWLSGAALTALAARAASGLPADKVLVKIAIVLLLTLNMRLIGGWATPLLERSVGRAPMSLDAARRTVLGAIGGLSAGCWLSALMLGAIGQFRPMTLEQLAPLFGGLLLAATLAGAALGLGLGLLRLRKPAGAAPMAARQRAAGADASPAGDAAPDAAARKPDKPAAPGAAPVEESGSAAIAEEPASSLETSPPAAA